MKLRQWIQLTQLIAICPIPEDQNLNSPHSYYCTIVHADWQKHLAVCLAQEEQHIEHVL